jgi:hypothetical protein
MSGSNGWLSLDACTSCSLNYFLPYTLFLYCGDYAAFLIAFLSSPLNQLRRVSLYLRQNMAATDPRRSCSFSCKLTPEKLSWQVAIPIYEKHEFDTPQRAWPSSQRAGSTIRQYKDLVFALRYHSSGTYE